MPLFARLRTVNPKSTSAELEVALREAYVTTFALYALPGLVLGLLLGRGGVGVVGGAGLLLLAVLLALVSWYLAERTRRDEQSPLHGAIRASIQAASAPAVPFLLACAVWRDAAAFASLLSVAALAFVLIARRALPKWATLKWQPSSRRPF